MVWAHFANGTGWAGRYRAADILLHSLAASGFRLTPNGHCIRVVQRQWLDYMAGVAGVADSVLMAARQFFGSAPLE